MSLVDYVYGLRDKFVELESEARKLSSHVNQEYSRDRKRIVTKKLSDGETEVQALNGSDDFRINTFYIIIDKLTSELKKRSKAYSFITKLFGFLSNILTVSDSELKGHI